MNKIVRFMLGAVVTMAIGIAAVFLMAFLLITLLNTCLPRKPIPTDEAMTAHFVANEAAFCELRDSMLTLRYGSYYPPHDRPDSTEYGRAQSASALPTERLQRMDSLLRVTGCEGIDCTPITIYLVECSWVRVTFRYWSRGSVISGTAKNYVYCPGLPGIYEKIGAGMVEGKETERILDETAYKDTTVYRHITGDWYIELEHD
ncbi:MAG: DUF4948 family protein [Prevotella sp.]|nr:DUF4948 family protein [Prevotella sp.]